MPTTDPPEAPLLHVVTLERKDAEHAERCLAEKVVPALPGYDALLKRPFDPARDTVRVELAGD